MCRFIAWWTNVTDEIAGQLIDCRLVWKVAVLYSSVVGINKSVAARNFSPYNIDAQLINKAGCFRDMRLRAKQQGEICGPIIDQYQ